MNILRLPGIEIEKVVFKTGSSVVSNRPSVPQRTIEATGFDRRITAGRDESLYSLALGAATLLPPEEVRNAGATVVATFSNPERFPSLSVRLAGALGVDASAPALDLQAACSAYPYALYVAGRLSADTGRSVLLIDGDVQSPYIDAADAATAPLFSDAATASLVRCTGRGESVFAFLSRPSDALECKAAGPLKMDGFGVFSFVAAEVAPFLEEFVAQTGGPDAIDVFAPHQANMYMVRQLARTLRLTERLATAGAQYANPGSCSIPMALASCGRGGRCLLAGYGAGLSAAAAVVSLKACAGE